MARESKWIEGVVADAPVSSAARHVVFSRLRAVARQLPLAALTAVREVENVHQLRVATRRAMAAVEIYADLLPRRRSAWMLKQLKRTRQAAGEARDLDVLAARLDAVIASGRDGPYHALAERVARLRLEAQAPIREIHQRLVERHFSRKARKLARKARWRPEDGEPEPNFAQACSASLAQVAEPMFAAAAAEPTDVEALHKLRILTKRLRYAMEIFAQAFEPEFRRELYPLVERIQESLGAINDHAAAVQRFEGWKSGWNDASVAGALDELLSAERAAVEQSSAAFFEWWTTDRRRELAERFEPFLAARTTRSVA